MLNRRSFLKKSIGITAGLSLLPYVKLRAETDFAEKSISDTRPCPMLWKATDLNIAWIGHSTVLINIFGKIILTDPVFFERIGLYFLGITFGPARHTAPALDIDEIPKPDIVLISHAHMDHMDYASLLHLTNKYKGEIDCITAYNTADVISELDWKSLTEMDWGEEMEIHSVKFKALEVKHFGWRYPWEKDRSTGYMEEGRSYNAYIISHNGRKVLFGGDTAFTNLFEGLKNENIEVAIMPIGAYYPWRKNHCTPEEALIMSERDINAKYFFPIHFNTFKQGREPIDEPMERLIEAIPQHEIFLAINKIGQTLTLET